MQSIQTINTREHLGSSYMPLITTNQCITLMKLHHNKVPQYAIEQRDNTDQSATSDKYFTTVPSSSTRDKFYSLKLQIDSAATCNTISIETIRRLFPDVKLENQHTCCTHMGTVNL